MVMQPDGLRIYGAGIISSATETVFSLGDDFPTRIKFDLQRVMRTRYRIDDFQESYFVIDHLDELLKLAHVVFAPLYEWGCGADDYEPGDVLSSDIVVTRGTGRYHADKKRASS